MQLSIVRLNGTYAFENERGEDVPLPGMVVRVGMDGLATFKCHMSQERSTRRSDVQTR